MKTIQFPAQLAKIETRVDGSIKLNIETQELGGQDMADLFNYRNQLGYITFTPNQEDNITVPKEFVGDMSKSPSHRLRSVLFILWKQNNKGMIFNQYYDIQMEKIIEQLKDKIDEN